MKPAFKWIRVGAVLGLLIMTTSMAASPVRDAVLPLMSRQLARWSVTPPVTTALQMSPELRSAAGGTAAEARLTSLAGVNPVAGRTPPVAAVEMPLAAAAGAATLTSSANWAADTASAAANAQSRASRFDVGPWRPNSAGSPGRSGSVSLRRVGPDPVGRAQRRGGNVRDSGRSGDAQIAATVSQARGSGPGSPRTSPTGPAPASPAPAPDTASTVLKEHTRSIPDLSPSTGAVAAGMPLAGLTSVSSSPEPSTLLLFGTGIVVAGRTLRRRLRRVR